MKTMKRFVAIFAMMVMTFTVFAGAAESVAIWTAPMPFDADNLYSGTASSTSSTAAFNIVDDWGMDYSFIATYGLATDGKTVVYTADDGSTSDMYMNDYYGDWAYTDIYSIPQYTPVIESLDYNNGGYIQYVWRDKDDNFWMTYAQGTSWVHIDNQTFMYDESFNQLSYEEARTIENAMTASAASGVSGSPDVIIANIQNNRDNIPKPGGSSFPTGIIAAVIVVIIGAGVVSFIRKKNRPATATAEGAPIDEQPVEKSSTERAAEAAAKAANMANDAATKATDAAKTAAFMAKEKANEFSKAFKDAQARQKAAEKIICPNCGTANDVGSKFCANCGTKLGDQ